MITPVAATLLFLVLWPRYPADAALHDPREGSTSLWSNATLSSSTFAGDVKRDLQFSGGLEKCTNDPATGLECLWCLQWDCPQGHFNVELPYCYSYTWSPNDDYRAESDIYVGECNSISCCQDTFTNIFNCKEFPDCPPGTESLLAPCSVPVPGTSTLSLPYLPCTQDICCGATPTLAPTPSPSLSPTPSPTKSPTTAPTPVPDTPSPTEVPTPSPTEMPTPSPTEMPTPSPTEMPTPSPTEMPTPSPTEIPTPSPTEMPTPSPTEMPTPSPTEMPTPSPTEMSTPSPTEMPTPSPTEMPTPSPTEMPTPSPTEMPTPSPTEIPTPSPTEMPTPSPTEIPTPSPTETPTPSPTEMPTPSPTEIPTPSPTEMPTPSPTEMLTPSPTETPTPLPTEMPTPSPTEIPTPSPREMPTPSPTEMRTPSPTEMPTPSPTEIPTPSPTEISTPSPTEMPTPSPTEMRTPSPTEMPTPSPTEMPTPSPMEMLTPSPAEMPTPLPTEMPTPSPTEIPTPSPTEMPTPSPTEMPTPSPTEMPTPSSTGIPTPSPTEMPTPSPTEMPTPSPTEMPTPSPTEIPTPSPTEISTPSPSEMPTPPTEIPTPSPTEIPTPSPTEMLTPSPTDMPTPSPTEMPTPSSTEMPSPSPTTPSPTTPAPTAASTTPSPSTTSPVVAWFTRLTPAPVVATPSQANVATLPWKWIPATPNPTGSPITPEAEKTPAPVSRTDETTAQPTERRTTQAPLEAAPSTPGPTTRPQLTRRPTSIPVTPMPTVLVTVSPSPDPTAMETESPTTVSPTPSPTAAGVTGVSNETCRSFVASGNVCDGGYVAVNSSIACGLDGCDQSTCCEEATATVNPTPMPTDRLRVSPGATPEDNPEAEPTATEDMSPPTPSPAAAEVVFSRTVATGAASVFAWSGLAVVTVGSMFGGGAASAAAPANATPPFGVERTGAAEAVAGQSSVSSRHPAVTLAMILVTQIQFVAMLSLVESTGTEDSVLLGFARNLRWVNLWPPASVGRAFLTRGGQPSQEEESSGCVFPVTSLSDIGGEVFLGNIALFTCILLSIFVVHILVASGVEACWMSKHRAKEEIATAARRGIPARELAARRTGRVAHDDSDDESNPATPADDVAASRKNSFDAVADAGIDYAEDGMPVWSRPKTRRALLLECRDRSRSAWLHFPHIELLFLLFAFEGAVASQLGALRDGGCPWVLYMACTALVVYPILLVILCCRTFFVRVMPDALILFKPRAEADSAPSFLSRVWTSLKEDHSLFGWANRGTWQTVETDDEETRREGDQFRIGFEPLFVDFEKSTAWFMVYSLLEMIAIACAAVMVDDSAVQLLLFSGLHALSFFFFVVFKPFANSVINAMGACVVFVDASCMALLADTVLRWEDTPRAKQVDTAVVVINVVVLVVLVIPIYIDSSTVMLGAIRRKLGNMAKSETRDGQEEEDAKAERRFIRRYVLGRWAPTWCSMLGSNICVCVRDTTRGVRRIKKSAASKQFGNVTAARTGPYRATNHAATPNAGNVPR